MPYCPNCKRSYDGDHCPLCGRSLDYSRSRHRLRNVNTWLPIIALVLCLSTRLMFHLVDDTPIFWTAWAVFLVPILVGYVWTSLSMDKLLWCDVAALFLMSLAIVGNCVLDKAAPTRVRATVIYRSSSQGRSHDYQLMVSPSWRPPRKHETLSVSREDYSRIHDEEPVWIDVYPGYFHLQWFDHVTPAEVSATR